MGGMIAQTMAIEQPERVRSLVSMMSTTGNRWLGWPHWRALGILFADYPTSREAYVKQVEPDLRGDRVARLPARTRAPRGDLAGGCGTAPTTRPAILRQMYAVTASGDRTPALRKLDLPTTVLHGTADRLVRPGGGRATARAIPGARLRMFKGMGHDLPRQLWPEFVEEIAANAARADATDADPAAPPSGAEPNSRAESVH